MFAIHQGDDNGSSTNMNFENFKPSGSRTAGRAAKFAGKPRICTFLLTWHDLYT
jgi:hypothetical protein